MGLINYTTYFWHRQKLRQYLCLWVFSIVIHESPIPVNQDFLAFFCLACKLLKCDLENINLILDIFRYVVSAYITGYLLLPYIENWFQLLFFNYFLLVNMSWMLYCLRYLNHAKYIRRIQKIKHYLCLRPFSILIYGKFNFIFYIFSFRLVFKLYKSSLQILQFISDHLIFLGNVDIGGYLIVALFER